MAPCSLSLVVTLPVLLLPHLLAVSSAIEANTTHDLMGTPVHLIPKLPVDLIQRDTRCVCKCPAVATGIIKHCIGRSSVVQGDKSSLVGGMQGARASG